ncbi:MAG: hypothetical protein M3548_16580 [Actinomycetota bacterium]|nr:hypothetical protein [Actinomycetota bacterium]
MSQSAEYANVPPRQEPQGPPTEVVEHTTTKNVPRTRGAVNGFLLVLLGLWGGLAPMIGPYFGLSYEPDRPWAMTSGRFWLEVLPAIAVIIGGLGLITSTRRPGGVFWGWLAALGGMWFIVGRTVSTFWNGDSVGAPTGSAVTGAITDLTFFTGLGALIVFLAAVALGRFTFGGQKIVERVAMVDGGAQAAPPQTLGPKRWWNRRGDDVTDDRSGRHHGLST